MKIDIQHVAKLARLKLSEEQSVRFEKEMRDILEMVEQLPSLPDGDIGVDRNHPMILREDLVTPSLSREDILKNAPKTQAGCVVVPKVL